MFYNSALIAKDIIKNELPETEIVVIDSKTAKAAEGFIAMGAAVAASEGKSLSQTLENVYGVCEKVKFLCLLQTMRYVY